MAKERRPRPVIVPHRKDGQGSDTVQKMACGAEILEKHGLDDIDGQILNIMLREGRVTHDHIAETIGLGRQAITKRVNKKKFQEALRETRGDVLDILIGAREKAARTIRSNLDSPDPRVAQRAAEKLLEPIFEILSPEVQRKLLLANRLLNLQGIILSNVLGAMRTVADEVEQGVRSGQISPEAGKWFLRMLSSLVRADRIVIDVEAEAIEVGSMAAESE